MSWCLFRAKPSIKTMLTLSMEPIGIKLSEFNPKYKTLLSGKFMCKRRLQMSTILSRSQCDNKYTVLLWPINPLIIIVGPVLKIIKNQNMDLFDTNQWRYSYKALKLFYVSITAAVLSSFVHILFAFYPDCIGVGVVCLTKLSSQTQNYMKTYMQSKPHKTYVCF